jgi:uncharacterized LabA/DUF88 family protein
MNKAQSNLTSLDTYVFIDVSNIRYACLRSCNIRLSFPKLIKYFQGKYKHLKSVKYFEGISDNDQTREKQFKSYAKLGYEIRSLSRKTYTDPAVYKGFICKKCKTRNRVKVLEKSKKLKSNVDVYIATELLEIAHLATKPTHIILMSCDGDYAEMIKSATKNTNICITVLATPPSRKYNALSIRLKNLTEELPQSQYKLVHITSIRERIS